MRVVGKNIFKRIASPDDWIRINRSLKEKSVGRLYSPLPKKISESILARLANYDLSTLYTINNRLLNLIQVIHHEVFYSCWPQIDKIIENAIKSVKDELSDLKDISDYLCKENTNSETINNETIRLQMVSKQSAVKIFPTFGKLIILQQVIQDQIESTPLGQSKAENFIQSYFDYPFTDENIDEAIIYCLTRDEKTDHLRSFLDHYEGKEIDPDSIEYARNSKLKLLLNKSESVFQEAIADYIRCLDDKKKVEFANYKVDLISKSNSLRFLQKESVQSLYTALSKANNSNPSSCTFSFTKPFSVFKSEASIVLMREELQRLLLECHKLLNKCLTDGHLSESYSHPEINTLELVSLYFFGCHRIQSDLIKQDIFDIARDHLLRWADLFSQQPVNKHNESVSQVAMAVHAFYLIKSGISTKFAEPINQWLFSEQYPYGHWQDNDEPLHTTILVLDALELMKDIPHPTFDASFTYLPVAPDRVLTNGPNDTESLSGKVTLTENAFTDNSIKRGDGYLIRFEGIEINSRSAKAWDYMVPLLINPGQSFNPLELQQRVNAPPSNRLMTAAAVDMMTGDNDEEFELRQTKTGQTANIIKLQAQSFKYLLKIESCTKDLFEKARADGRENDMHMYEDDLEAIQKEIRNRNASHGQDPAERDPAYSKAYDLIKKHHKSIMNALKTKHPSLCRHFGLYLKVGTICLYDPEPRIYWTVN